MKGKVFSVGVDVGGTNIKFCVLDQQGATHSRHKVRTATRQGNSAIVESIIANVRVAIDDAGLRPSEIHSIGLGIPGTTDSKRGRVLFAPNIFMVDCEIAEAIQCAYDIPVYVAQDTRAAAWGEYLAGAGRGMASIASVTLGTGVGCGMVIDGKIFNGALNTAGELGHQIVEISGRACNCGRHGCLEAYAGGLAIVRIAKESIPVIEQLLEKSADLISTEDIFNLARAGNADARRITDKVVEYIGIGLVNLVNIMSPELVCISGGMSNAPADLLLSPLCDFVRRNAYPRAAGLVKICKSALGEDAPLVGAALLHREATMNAMV